MSALPSQKAKGQQWVLPLVLSLLGHSGLALALYRASPPSPLGRDAPIILVDRKLPTSPKAPEPVQEKDPPEEAAPLPKPPPKAPAPPKKRPAPRRRPSQRPPPAAPPSPPAGEPTGEAAQTPRGPQTFGLQMEGTTQASPGQGVEVPAGDTPAANPSVRERGKPTRGFKKSYAAGDPAPLAVVTTKPMPVKRVQPEYPEEMRELGIEGRVVVELTIEASGRVAAAKVLRGLHPAGDEAAVRAARQMTFEPGKVDGTPVRVKIAYTFAFVLD